MAKRVPASVAPLAREIGCSGMPAVLRITRSLSLNGHAIYGLKSMDGGWGTLNWNEDFRLYVPAAPEVEGSAGQSVEVAKFRVPESFAGTNEIVVCSQLSLTSTAAAGRLRFVSAGGTEATCGLSPIDDEVVRLSPGSWTVYLDSMPGALGTATLLGLYLWYKRATIHGEAPDWQPLAQAAFAPDEPDDAYVLQTLIRNQNHVIGEPSSTIFSRWFGLPWAIGSNKDAGIYAFYVDRHVAQITIWFYARAFLTSGKIRVLCNGSEIYSAEIAPPDGWKWFKFTADNIAQGSINEIAFAGDVEKEDNQSFIEIASVCAWEEPCTAADLSLPGADTVPANYRGNDAERMIGFFPALADKDGEHDAGTKAINEDTIWLKSKMRRMLIWDWRHRTAYAPFAEFLHNGVSYWQRDFDDQVPWRLPDTSITAYNDTSLEGSVLARMMIPPGHRKNVDVFMLVQTIGEHYDSVRGTREPISYEVQVEGASVTQERVVDPGPRAGLRWIGPFTVDRSANAATEIVARGRSLHPNPKDSRTQTAALQLYSMAFREAPHDGVIP